MASFNLTNFDAAMKHMYPYKKVENLVYKNNPLFAMIPKETTFPGRNATYAVEYGMTTGRSADFQTAQNNRGGTKLEDFVVTRVKDYAVVSVDNETLLAADGSEGSLLDVAKAKTDSALHVLSRTMGRDVYRSGTGSIMKLAASSAVSGSVVTPLTAAGTIQVEVGMRLKGSATDGSALYDGVLTVQSVDRKANTFTTTVAPGTAMASLGNDDFLYVEGDAANAGSNIKMSGLDSWLPSTIASSGDSHFGVNRYTDSTRLGGQRQDFTSSSIQNTLINASVLVAREGGRPMQCLSIQLIGPSSRLTSKVVLLQLRAITVVVMITVTIWLSLALQLFNLPHLLAWLISLPTTTAQSMSATCSSLIPGSSSPSDQLRVFLTSMA